MLRSVNAARYVMPFREGGSVPALVEGDDLGMYVVKLRGAGQGAKALIAEVLAGELARAAGLAVPELAFVTLDRAIADSEPDPELALPLEKSAGLNLGMDYLPGSITFDPVAGLLPDAALAARVVMFDAYSANIDRTPRNPNLLTWHSKLWLIDHGASLYHHHAWRPDDALSTARDPFLEVKDHVLLRYASRFAEAAQGIAGAITDDVVDTVVAAIPSSWLAADHAFDDEALHRAAYVSWLRARREALPILVEEAERARALLV